MIAVTWHMILFSIFMFGYTSKTIYYLCVYFVASMTRAFLTDISKLNFVSTENVEEYSYTVLIVLMIMNCFIFLFTTYKALMRLLSVKVLDSKLEERQVANISCSKYIMEISVHSEVCMLAILALKLF